MVLLRADVGRLPFPTGSVAAMHAGAAIHCWPNPQVGVRFHPVAACVSTHGRAWTWAQGCCISLPMSRNPQPAMHFGVGSATSIRGYSWCGQGTHQPAHWRHACPCATPHVTPLLLTAAQAALAEISRVLAPGGVFVGTTFLVGGRVNMCMGLCGVKAV